jgi:hypothetical protein
MLCHCIFDSLSQGEPLGRLASGLLDLSNPTLPVRVGTSH